MKIYKPGDVLLVEKAGEVYEVEVYVDDNDRVATRRYVDPHADDRANFEDMIRSDAMREIGSTR